MKLSFKCPQIILLILLSTYDIYYSYMMRDRSKEQDRASTHAPGLAGTGTRRQPAIQMTIDPVSVAVRLGDAAKSYHAIAAR